MAGAPTPATRARRETALPEPSPLSPARDYREVYRAVARLEQQHGSGRRSARNGVSKKVTSLAAEQFGLTKVDLPKGAKPTFSEAHERYGDCMVSTTKHVAALTGGALRDTFDGRTYEWQGAINQRKAMSVWVAPNGDAPAPSDDDPDLEPDVVFIRRIFGETRDRRDSRPRYHAHCRTCGWTSFYAWSRTSAIKNAAEHEPRDCRDNIARHLTADELA